MVASIRVWNWGSGGLARQSFAALACECGATGLAQEAAGADVELVVVRDATSHARPAPGPAQPLRALQRHDRPLEPYAIRGAIWYQGESNGPTARLYFRLMETLIADWRRGWGEGSFPFLFVQLANINRLATQPVVTRSTVALIREGQLQTLALPKTGMAVAVDIGDPTSIHPKNKQEVGRRLALIARALVYHQNVAYSGPIYRSMAVEGSVIRLHFTHVDGGLAAKGGQLIGFAIAGADHRWVWADARIDGDAVIVSSPQVVHPVAVRYGWADNPSVSLYNKAGLPASPFRTDAG